MSQRREQLRKIAERTLEALERGYYVLPGPPSERHELRPAVDACKKATRYFAADSALATWKEVSIIAPPTAAPASGKPKITFLEVSSIEGTRYLAAARTSSNGDVSQPRIGLLNFASATKPGGGFLNGAQAQEESLARSSTLYPSLMTSVARAFHTVHKKDKKGGYYTHACVYSPGVLFFRDDTGGWTQPLVADVLTCAAVNAGVARKTLFGTVGGAKEEERIERAMRERMGRVLALFEREGVRDVVLGAFGTGVFQNDIAMVARVWADLLIVDGARFATSFNRVVFAILGTKTFDDFKKAFEKRSDEGQAAWYDIPTLVIYNLGSNYGRRISKNIPCIDEHTATLAGSMQTLCALYRCALEEIALILPSVILVSILVSLH